MGSRENEGNMKEIDIKAAMVDIESSELLATARKMMVAAVGDVDFNWSEAERLAALPDFGVLEELRKLRAEVVNG